MTEERAHYGEIKQKTEEPQLHPAVLEYKKHLEGLCLMTGFSDKSVITRNIIIIDCFVEHFLPGTGWKLVKTEDVDVLGVPKNLLIDKCRESKG